MKSARRLPALASAATITVNNVSDAAVNNDGDCTTLSGGMLALLALALAGVGFFLIRRT